MQFFFLKKEIGCCQKNGFYFLFVLKKPKRSLMRTKKSENPCLTGKFGVSLKDQTCLPPMSVSLLLFSGCVVISFLLCFFVVVNKQVQDPHNLFKTKNKKRTEEVITIRWKVTLSKQYSSCSWTFIKKKQKNSWHEHFKHNTCHSWILHFLPWHSLLFFFSCHYLIFVHILVFLFSFYGFGISSP